MKTRLILSVFCLLFPGAALFAQVTNEGAAFGGIAADYAVSDVRNRYFVVFHEPPGAAERQMVESHGAQIIWAYKVIPAFAVYAPSSSIVDAIRQDSRVRYVDNDKVVYALGDEANPEMTDAQNDQASVFAAHDIVKAWIQQMDDDRLQFFIKVRDLTGVNQSTGDGLPPNTRWKINFSLQQPGKATADQYFVEMRRGETGAPTFHWGFLSGTSSVTGGTADAGQILVAQSTITITNSISKFSGAPNGNGPITNGDVLSAPFAQVQELGGTSVTGGVLVQVDRAPNAGGGRSFTVRALLASPKALDFGSVMLGASKTLTITVRNTNPDPLVISLVQSNNSSYTVSPTSATIPSGSSETFSVAFTPASSGPQFGTLFFYNNATSWAGTVSLRGTGFSLNEGESTPWGVAAVNAPRVWNRTTGRSVKVAVLDTGIDSLHWELDGRYRGGYNFVARNGNPWDGHGHGTHVSGTIAAELNGSGLMGVSHDVELYALKVLSDGGSGSFADVYAAIDWCLQNGIHIVNMSLGGRVYDPTGELVFQNAFNAGLLSIAAAGNGVNGIGTPHVNYPAAYQGVVAVGAVGKNLQRAAFSDFGPNIEVVAPGVDVRSTVPRGIGREAVVEHAGTMLEANPLAFAALTGGAGVTGKAVPSGRGLGPADFPPEVNGNIALIERGDISFAEKVRNAQDAGAIAVIIYNNAPGNFSGTLGTPTDEVRNRPWVPAVSLSQEDGQVLVAAGRPTITVFNVASDFAKFQGTSMASPHAAAVAALVKAANFSLTNQQIRTILRETATDLGAPLYDPEYGYGLVNAEAAVNKVTDPSFTKFGSVSNLGDRVMWTGFIAAGAQSSGPNVCTFEGPANDCDRFFLQVNAPLQGPREVVRVTINNFGMNDLDLVIRNEQGQTVASSGAFAGIAEGASFPANPGTYEIIVIGYAAAAANYSGLAEVIQGPGVRQPTYVQGGIQFSPNVTPQAPELPRGGEPSIRVDRDGFVYAGGIRGLTSGGVDLWRWDTKSDPCLRNPQYLGQPIEIPETQVGGLGGGDLEIAISQPDNPNDTPVITIASLLLANVPVAISFDRGRTWERHEVGDLLIGGTTATDRRWLTAYGNNTLYLSVRSLASPTLSDLYVSTSIDHGRTWSPRSIVRLGANSTPGYLDVDRRPIGSGPGAGNIYYSHQNANTMFVSVAEPSPIPGVSPTGGPLTFQTFVVDNTTGHGHLFDVVRVGRDGTLYAVWSDDFNIYLATSTDQARTWSPPVRVNDPNTVDVKGRPVRTNIFPWLVPGDRGRVGIVWFGSNGVNNGDNGGDWAVYYAFTDNALDFNPTFRQAQASDHFIHAFNVSELGLGSGGATNRNLLDFFQVDMDPTGAAVIAFADDHNDFDGQTYVARQIAGPSLLASVGTVSATTCPPIPLDHNPNRVASDPEVIDFPRDAQVLRRTTIQTDVPFDITSIDYQDAFSETGARQLSVTIAVSDMTNPPLEGFHWVAFFTANARDNLFDRGQSFFVEASTDPRDGASALAPLFFYGTAARRADGAIISTRVGAADAGSFDSEHNTVTIKLGLEKVNAIADPDVVVGSRLIGLRGISFAGGGVDITGPVIGRITGADVERDFTRGGIDFIVGSQEPRLVLDCDDPSITRFGGWHQVEDERAAGGHYCRSVGAKNGSASLSFTFTGSGVDVHYATGPRGGTAEVFIDGVSQGRIDFYRAPSDPNRPDNSGKKDLTFGVVARYSVSPGTHTFRLNVLNDGPSSSPPRNMVYVDGFVVRGAPQGTGNPTETQSLVSSTVSPASLVSQTLEAGSSTTLMTGVLEAPEGTDLDLVVLNPLGAVVAQSRTSESPEVVQFAPATTGLYIFQVINNSLTASADFTLYQITTQMAIQSTKTVAQETSSGEPPNVFALHQNYPNPFNPVTHIAYRLPGDGYATLRVYDMIGREVAVLARGMQSAGVYSVRFDARRLPSGVYYYRLEFTDAEGKTRSEVKSMMLLR
ncbi:MAG TPA: S8 family serine peptidase [Bacteroidota bacterium]|nr:S8 family serine peptidase [Bacteroidota bacterium]